MDEMGDRRAASPRLTFLGSTSTGGACPTLYRLGDDRIVVQGAILEDPALIRQAHDVLPGEVFVVVPAELGRFWPAGNA
jgi:hypothetical protein